jgi:hypothetical protein
MAYEERRLKWRQAARERHVKETPEQTALRREKDRLRARWKRGTATPQEIQHYESMLQYKKRVQIQETTDEKQARLAKQRDRQRMKEAMLTPEQKLARAAKAKAKRAAESPEKRELREEKDTLKRNIQRGNGRLPDKMRYAELTSFDRMLDLKIETEKERKVRLLKDREYRRKKQSNMTDEEKKLQAKKAREQRLNEAEENRALRLKKAGLRRKLRCSWWWTDKEWAEKEDEYNELLSRHRLIDVAWKVETKSQRRERKEKAIQRWCKARLKRDWRFRW